MGDCRLAIRRQALEDALTIDEMATLLQVPARTLRGRADRLKIGRVVGGVRLLLPEDGDRLRLRGKPGPKPSPEP